jgi:hypothetical protein
MDERAIRRALGMTEEVVDQALAGQELPGEAIERLVNFLEDGAGGQRDEACASGSGFGDRPQRTAPPPLIKGLRGYVWALNTM